MMHRDGSERGPVERARVVARRLVEQLDVQTPFGPILLPSAGFYTGVFAWDSAWHYFFLKELDASRAVAELETLFATADGGGRVPHETRLDGEKPSGLLRRLAIRMLEPSYGPDGRSHFIDPPVYAWAAADAVATGLVSGDRALGLLRQAAGSLRAFLERRTIADLPYPYCELPVILHPLESGTDASPQFDEIYGGVIGLLVAMLRLPSRLGRLAWDPLRAVAAGIPAVFDVTLISFYLLGLVELRRAYDLYLAAGVDGGSLTSHAPDTPVLEGLPSADQLRRLVEATADAFLDEDASVFTSRWFDGAGLHACRTATLSGVLLLLVPGAVPDERAREMVARHVAPGGIFYRGALPRYTLPRTARFRRSQAGSDCGRERLSALLWRGPCSWMNLDYCVWMLLGRYGRSDAATRLAGDAISAVETVGPYEYLHCNGAAGGGAQPFSWNGLVLPMTKQSYSDES
jgi:hypothetical protein